MKKLIHSHQSYRLKQSLWIILLLFSQSLFAIQTLSGDLLNELKQIDYGDKDENTWKEPDSATLATFGSIMDAFLAEDFASADSLASTIGYEVVEYNDTGKKPVREHYILREKNPLPSSQFFGGGTYVLNPRGSQVGIQAPHPITDLFTSTQAIETYLETKSRLLFLAGARRDNSTLVSACTDGSYRKSDSSHYTGQLFYVAHTRASDFDPQMVFVQFHGFGTSSLEKLQTQCGTTDDKLVNLSEGVNYQSDPSSDTFMHIFNRNINQGGIIQSCVYGNDTSSLGATWTTTGRYTNHSHDPCLNNASSSSQRFVHVEQSYRVRSNYRQAMNQYLSATISEYFKGSGGKKGRK